ncbi:MAG: tRNA(m5U54)methyltransferase [Trizodia sp. TS-e1964]|nr:MAG: tRNA(m5U54)methyltransferase [Trizodia sp. TS-e1964]
MSSLESAPLNGAEPVTNPIAKKRGFGNSKSQSKKHKIQPNDRKEGSNNEVLLADVKKLSRLHAPATEKTENNSAFKKLPNNQLPAPFTELDVEVSDISSIGDGLAWDDSLKHVLVVPFTVPGDVVRVKIIKHFPDERYSLTDFVKVLSASPMRDDSGIKCKYFSTCSGCQLQMLSYPEQLAHKKRIVEKAYKNFSELPPEAIPAVGDTIASPLQYGYRTKLTPHFDGPPGKRNRQARKNGTVQPFETVPPIGFMAKGPKKILDIEDCPIGTEAVRLGMKRERKRVAEELETYKRGATLLLRENTIRKHKNTNSTPGAPSETLEGGLPVVHPPPNNTSKEYVEEKTCISDSRAIATEYIGEFKFENSAGAFFQNNNSILPRFIEYIRQNILPPVQSDENKISHLIDAYCGSGLFTITLSSLFTSSIGIDISSQSIDSARSNAKNNSIPNATFIAADAPALFAEVTYPPAETVMIIDPPRKGCDESFLRQLLSYGPSRVVYVSCNVHTQARDVGFLVGDTKGYEIESITGFDFFPQTGHVEGVAVLSKRAVTTKESST